MAQAFNRGRGRKFLRNCGEKAESKLNGIRERVEQIVMNMKSPMRGVDCRVRTEQTYREDRGEISEREEEGVEGVEGVLKANGLSEYIEVFRENQIKFEDLRFLNREDLVDMNIPVGPRNKILRVVDGMRNQKENQIEYEEFNYDHCKKSSGKLMQRRLPRDRKKLSLDVSRIGKDQQKAFENITEIVREISVKNEYIIKAIEENQRAIIELRHRPGFRKYGNMSQN